jgi:hypothetical protein
MATRQKKVNVIELITWANNQLARTDEFMTSDIRCGICSSLEQVLFLTGTYAGFNYLYWLERGIKEWEAAGTPEKHPEKNRYIYGEVGSKYDGSPYARSYYVHHSLIKK